MIKIPVCLSCKKCKKCMVCEKYPEGIPHEILVSQEIPENACGDFEAKWPEKQYNGEEVKETGRWAIFKPKEGRR